MKNFIFQNDTKIYFGKDVENQVGQKSAAHGKTVLLHYGQGSIKKYGLYDRVLRSLHSAGLKIVELSGVQPNPRVSLIRQGILLCKNEGVDLVLAVGGGSVIDSAKGIAAGVYAQGDIWDQYSGKRKVPKKVLPIGVILTLPAAGSETSGSSVVTNEEGWWKRDIGANQLRPRFCFLNPELTFTLPEYQTSCGIADMLAHVMERYFTTEEHVELTDRLCEAAMITIINQAKVLKQNPLDYNARAEIMWCGTIAHNDLLGTGRIGDWSTHGIEHEVSGIYDLAHGAGLSILFPAWLKYQSKRNPDKILQFCRKVMQIETIEDDIAINAGIEGLEDFYRLINLPVRLSDAGIGDERFEEMADKATDNGNATVGNYVPLTKSDIIEILKLAM